MMYEDIFSVTGSKDVVRKIIIRYTEKTKEHFNDSNKKITIEQVFGTLSEGEWPCFLSKRNEDEFVISVPIEELGGQADLVVSYNPNNYSYELKVSYAKKTKFRSCTLLPDPNYSIPVKATFVFLAAKETYVDFAALSAMSELKDQVLKLDVPPGMSIEMQQDIWTDYIEAQSQIIDALNEPFEIEGEPRLSTEMRENGEGVYRYRLELPLPAKDYNEFVPLKQAMMDELELEASFDNDGASFLRLDDIGRVLKPVVHRRFPDRYEVDSSIGCILRVRPISPAERIADGHPELGTFYHKGGILFAEDVKVSRDELVETVSRYGFEPVAMGIDYRITNVSNLYKSPHVAKYGITFSEDRSFKNVGTDYQKKEICLPEPVNGSTFRIEHGMNANLENSFAFFHATLKRIYGEENIECKAYYKFRPLDRQEEVDGFTEAQWNDIRRDLYALEFEYNVSDAEGGKIIAFDFETKEQLETIYKGISSIGKFHVMKSPLDDDFLFKARVHLVAKKTEKEIFAEKLKRLSGVDFVYEHVEEKEDGHYTRTYVNIGKLNGFNSSSERLVLYLPYFFKSDQKETDKFLKFYKEHGSEIDSVHANLRGDRSKLDWLKDAISKLGTTSGISGPNDTPVNEKIRDFIFDTSKAEPVFRYDQVAIEETPEFKEFDRTAVLKLNPRQKIAVLKGVSARDLCMLQGPPGTGKTTVIAELIWQHIRRNPKQRLLLTSETNLAVDNALEKLMNDRAVNPDMARYLSLIKPLRFGKSDKFEEEGKRYSIERIERWVDDTVALEDDYDAEVLGEEGDALTEEEVVVENPSDNIVQHWMQRIADRSQAGNPRYAEVMKDWTMGLAMPDKETRKTFRDLYYQNVNVVGSTCSSTGSPAFLMEYLRSFKGISSPESAQGIKVALGRWRKFGSLNHRALAELATLLGIDTEDWHGLSFSDDEIRDDIKRECTIRFDTVIMDEASKATPPELLLPLCFGRKSIVIGDHRQLPPMLNEKSFKEALLDLHTQRAEALAEEIDRDFVDTSQFKRMILNREVSPTIKSTFNVQYRMHPDINDVIRQFYVNDESGGLECGLDPEQVNTSDLSNPQSRYHGFLKKGFISPDVHTIWVNVNAPEESDGTSKVNDSEIRAINTVLEKLVSADGFKEYLAHWDTLKEEYKRNEEKEIGVISFYGRQAARIRQNVKPRAKSLGVRIKINTVDKFQGMERNIVVVSTVRSNRAKKGAGIVDNTDPGFAKSPERLNVALSRARRLLIVVGNKDFFSTIKDREGNYIYRNAIREIEKKGLVINYPDLLRHE